jgi:hypothetical protein
MNDYFSNGEVQAYTLPNRGPLKFTDDGELHPDILDAYWRYGFYVFEGVISSDEVGHLVADFESMMARAPTHQGSEFDAQGRPSIDLEFESTKFRFAKPLSDPMGATDRTGGRYPVKMTEFEAPSDGPEEVLLTIGGSMQIMESNLRLYGHPKLLRVAESINGPDFAPFKEAVWVKPAHYGAAVSWHQDGTTHWENPNLDAGTHGFNFMAQLYPTNPMNALWIIPESHDKGKADIKKLIMENGGSDKLPGAVPLLCAAGDIAICSRQMLHCSFPNTSDQTRVTFVFGFHRRASVQGVQGWDVQSEKSFFYDDARIHGRSKIIQLAIDARQQSYPHETPYVYLPMVQEAESLRWSQQTRETVLKNYNQLDLGI